jgi:hypothetical protein
LGLIGNDETRGGRAILIGCREETRIGMRGIFVLYFLLIKFIFYFESPTVPTMMVVKYIQSIVFLGFYVFIYNKFDTNKSGKVGKNIYMSKKSIFKTTNV